jgi:hypothetical protein
MNDPRAARLTGNQCHCRSCDQYFTTVRGFDRHLRGTGRPKCVWPAEVGLVMNKHGYWQSPAPEVAVVYAMKPEQEALL